MIRMMLPVVLSVAIFTFCPTRAIASESFDFANSFLTSLSYIKQSTQHAHDGIEPKNEKADADNLKPLLDALTGLRLAQNDLKYAVASLNIAASKENTDSAKSRTKALLDCIATLNNHYEHIVAIFKELYRKHTDKEIKEFDPVEMSDEVSKMNANIDDTFNTITLASTMATYALIEYPAKNAPGNLSMSDDERKKLLHDIEKNFPSASGGLKEGVLKVDGGAAAFQQVLSKFPIRS